MDGQPVRLKYAVSVSFSPGGGLTGVNVTQVSAKVQNLAMAKEVALRYAQPDGSWTERLLSWQKHFGTYDLFALNDNTFVTTQFVIRYAVAGQTFWDNNHGNTYRVDSSAPNTVG